MKFHSRGMTGGIYFSLFVVTLFFCASISLRFFTWRQSGKLSANVILFVCGTPIFPRHCDRAEGGILRSMKLEKSKRNISDKSCLYSYLLHNNKR